MRNEPTETAAPSPPAFFLSPSEETIAAVASALGGGARAIVRISGPTAFAVLDSVFLPSSSEPRHGANVPQRHTGELRVPGLASTVPCDAYLWPTTRSYTRQPTVELHFVGSPPLVDAVLGEACRRGARPARPGEFTLRAFLAGRLDLMQAEAILGVVDAVERRQLDVALRQMAGGFTAPLDRLRNELLDVTAHLEAGLDFVEEDITFIGRRELIEHLQRADAEVCDLLDRVVKRTEARELPRVVLVGRPNVGKSSLFNALAERSDAIVSAVAGTTRDYLTTPIRFDDLECELFDTAGLDAALAAGHDVERSAQSRTEQRALEADLRLFCVDASQPPDAWELARLSQPDSQRIIVRTKADLGETAISEAGIAVSALSGAGLPELRRAIRAALVESRTHGTEVVAATAVRCRDGLERLHAALAAAADLAEREAGEELVAVELRLALDELGRLVGTIYTDDVLDRIFSRFCIGK